MSRLNGIIKSHLGKGQFTDLSTGHAGQLLRLLSVDALLRKLRFDFSDTFSEGFYFDSINSTAWIKDGVLHTDDTLVDGLEADIAMKGSVDLVRRQLDLQAVVAPEISATVGVAAAFAVNPIVGAAVFGIKFRFCATASPARLTSRRSMKCCARRAAIKSNDLTIARNCRNLNR